MGSVWVSRDVPTEDASEERLVTQVQVLSPHSLSLPDAPCNRASTPAMLFPPGIGLWGHRILNCKPK